MSKEAMKLALEWANKHGEIVFAGGGMTAVEGMNNWVKIFAEDMARQRSKMNNERIKELAVQAGYTKDMFGIGHWDMPECKKFAELIVAECAYIAAKNQAENMNWDIAEIIKDHFGVEE